MAEPKIYKVSSPLTTLVGSNPTAGVLENQFLLVLQELNKMGSSATPFVKTVTQELVQSVGKTVPMVSLIPEPTASNLHLMEEALDTPFGISANVKVTILKVVNRMALCIILFVPPIITTLAAVFAHPIALLVGLISESLAKKIVMEELLVLLWSALLVSKKMLDFVTLLVAVVIMVLDLFVGELALQE